MLLLELLELLLELAMVELEELEDDDGLEDELLDEDELGLLEDEDVEDEPKGGSSLTQAFTWTTNVTSMIPWR